MQSPDLFFLMQQAQDAQKKPKTLLGTQAEELAKQQSGFDAVNKALKLFGPAGLGTPLGRHIKKSQEAQRATLLGQHQEATDEANRLAVEAATQLRDSQRARQKSQQQKKRGGTILTSPLGVPGLAPLGRSPGKTLLGY